jgi:protein-tyrosine-phosphatase
MAEQLARRELEALGWTQVEVGSAGVAASEGAPASGGALRVAARHGIDLAGHGSRFLTRELVEQSDLVLAMSTSHVRRVLELGGQGRVALLGAFAEGGEDTMGPTVPDPFGGDDAVYEATFQVLEDLVSRSVRRLEPIVAP